MTIAFLQELHGTPVVLALTGKFSQELGDHGIVGQVPIGLGCEGKGVVTPRLVVGVERESAFCAGAISLAFGMAAFLVP